MEFPREKIVDKMHFLSNADENDYDTFSPHIYIDDEENIKHIILNRNVDIESSEYGLDEPIGNIKYRRTAKLKDSKLNCFLENLFSMTINKEHVNENISEQYEEIIEPKSPEQYTYQFMTHDKPFTTFMRIAASEFLNITDLRYRLWTVHDFMIENVLTSEKKANFESFLPLSTTNAWIWMCAEVVEILKTSGDFLQDPRDENKPKEFIREKLLSISNKMESLKKRFHDFNKKFRKFSKKFGEIQAIIRRNFCEAVSIEVEELRERFLQESQDRSMEVNSILSRANSLSDIGLEKPEVRHLLTPQYICWGIDGLSLRLRTEKSTTFILLNVVKNNPKRFLRALESFFDGFDYFLNKCSTYLKSFNNALTKLYDTKNQRLEYSFLYMTQLSNTMDYVYPIEQTRGVQGIWQIEQAIHECSEFAENLTLQLDKSRLLWRSVFGRKLVKFDNDLNVSLEPFLDWKFCKGLTFKLELVKKDIPKISGKLSLLVPNKCSENTPLYFQVFENILVSLVDFQTEYNHRINRLRLTGEVLDEDAMVCNDAIQHVYYTSSIMVEKIRRVLENLETVNNKLVQAFQMDPNSRVVHGLNLWFYVCTECILSMNRINLTSQQKQNFLSEFQNSFQMVEKWFGLVKTLIRKYKYNLKELKKLQKFFGSNTYSVSTMDYKRSASDTSIVETETNQGLSILLTYNGLLAGNSGEYYNLREDFKEVPFAEITKLFINHTKDILPAAIETCSESVELIYSYKTSKARANGRKEIITIPGVRAMIQEIEVELEKPFNMNRLECLVGHLSLKNLERQINELMTPLEVIKNLKIKIRHGLEYPKLVLNARQKGYRKPKMQSGINSVGDNISGILSLRIKEKPLAGELKHIIARVKDTMSVQNLANSKN